MQLSFFKKRVVTFNSTSGKLAKTQGKETPPSEDQCSYRSAFMFPFLVATTVLGIIRIAVAVQGRQLRVQRGLVQRGV